jgi:hypothetical protein
MATTTIDPDTELSAVNSILGSIGQSPLTTLNFNNPETAFVYNLLVEANKDIQNAGWHFNTEDHVLVTPDATTKYISIPSNYLRYDLHDKHIDKSKDLVKRNGRLYDLVNHTDQFEEDLFLDIVTLYPFEDVPPVFQRYIISQAATRAAAQLVSNTELVKLLNLQLEIAKANAVEYECNQGDHSFMGWPHETAYRPYQPYNVLNRR